MFGQARCKEPKRHSKTRILNQGLLGRWEATRRLKSNPETHEIPVIALSAHAVSGTREKALAAGCDEFDTKPIDFERLVAAIRRLLDAGKRAAKPG